MGGLTKEQKELASKLNANQRKFVMELVKPGVSKRQAYLKANGKATSPSSQDSSASTMFRNVKVRAFYDALLYKKEEEAIFSRDNALKILEEIANDAKAPASGRVSSIKQAAEMQGWNAPKKTELTGSEGAPVAVDVSSPDVAAALSGLMSKL